MQKYIYSLFIVILFGLFTITQANDDLVTDPVIENFNVNAALGDVRTLKASIDILTQQLFALDAQEIGEEGMSERYQEVRDEIVSVINTIQGTTMEVDVIMRRVGQYKRNIDTTAQTIRALRHEIEQTKQMAEEFAVFIYKTNNYIADPKSGLIDEVRLLIHSDNIPRTLSNQQVVESVLDQFALLLEKLHEAEKQHTQAIVQLNRLRNSAKNDILVYSAELEKMQQQKQYLKQFIKLYKDGYLHNAALISNIFQNPKDVHEAIMTMIDDVYKKNYTVDFNIFEAFNELESLNANTKMPHDLARPIYPIDDISWFFDNPNFREQYGFPNWGIQIATEQGTPTYSVRDGIVYHVSNNDDMGINWLLIIHTDGYISTYSYLNQIVVQPGDLVRRGQLIGYSGGEIGTRGAGFMAPGANLYFSVFKNGTPIDPLTVLDISVVKDRSVLPAVYSIKYLRDKYARGVDISNLAHIEGDTVDERAQNFLYGYGVGVYRSLTFWDNAVVGTNVDRDMVICVAFAESTLGRYLSTPNNIGNVGNNDRGDRFAFGSALAGARAIAQTLNNQFLGHYHTIDQLSRYGNSDGSIYASSPINWQTNVLKCLSQIKGYYVPEDFPFRTGVNPNWFADRIVSGGFDWQQVRRGSDQ